jgi:N-methylhydantoinase B
MAGGGGYGDPFLRDPEAVKQDVLLGLVSIENAQKEYGVIFIDSKSFEIDYQLTASLRMKLN